MSFALYSLGYLIVIVGVGYLMHVLHIPQTYMIATVLILLGIGIVTGVQSTRQKDPN